MLYYNRIDLSEGIDVTRNNNSKKCIVCHYWCFNHGSKFQKSVCAGCDGWLMLCLNISDISMIIVKSINYRCIIHDISKSDAIHFVGKLCAS